MSFQLANAVPPINISTKSCMATEGNDYIELWADGVQIIIPMSDFCRGVEYVLTNLGLLAHDPRLGLVERIKSMLVVTSARGYPVLQVDPRLSQVTAKNPT